MNALGYDDPSTCACCGNSNHEIVLDQIANNVCEIDLICFRCGFADFWGYGYSQGKSLGWNINHRIMWKLKTGQVTL